MKRTKPRARPPRQSARRAPREDAVRECLVVGFGASAGGLEAFTHVLAHLPVDLGMAYVLVQHLDPTHESMLRDLLTRATKMPVHEVVDGLAVRPDRVYVIPPNATIRIANGKLRVSPRASEGQRKHTTIDSFFRSLAEDCKGRSIGVILSGTASDGVLGLEAIKAEGGITISQDEETAKYAGMPHSAIAAGVVDLVFPPEGIARELERIARHQATSGATLQSEAVTAPTNLQKVFAHLRKSSGVDFSSYKLATISRRITRRIALHRLSDLQEYVRYLGQNPGEVDALFQDLLIKVTHFFRDPGLFQVLRARIFPSLLKNRPKDLPLRVWVPGCATGEEAYSIAIALTEYLSQGSQTIPIQVFATDLSEAAIERARIGIYPESIAADISPARLRRFFVKVERGYQIAKPIRDLCILARHDITSDPPFSKLDLISCRNVLIYLEAAAQRRVIPNFHYALRPGGFLLLGSSEAIGTFTNLFSVYDRANKVYAKKPALAPAMFEMPVHGVPGEKAEAPGRKPPQGLKTEIDIQKEVDRLILSRYSPAGVLVNEDLEILSFRGRTELYLTHAPGRASFHLFKMVCEGLQFALRQAIQKARKTRARVRTEGVQVRREDEGHHVAMEILPIRSTVSDDCYYLVLFDRVTSKGAEPHGRPTRQIENRLITELREELAGVRETLQATVEEHEATSEEFKAANEEILSSNEELQSTNEELETAKEELQSANEELTTLNEELQNRNQELTQVNNDISNLLGSVQIPIVMLGEDLRIRRFTPSAEGVMNLIASDVGRPIGDIRPNLDVNDLDKLIADTAEHVRINQREAQDKEGRWHRLTVRPYRTREGKFEGAVIVVVDIDAFKREIDWARQFAEAMVESGSGRVALLDDGLVLRRASTSFLKTVGLGKEEAFGRRIGEIPVLAPLLGALDEAKRKGKTQLGIEASLPRGEGAAPPLRASVRAIKVAGPAGPSSALILVEIEER